MKHGGESALVSAVVSGKRMDVFVAFTNIDLENDPDLVKGKSLCRLLQIGCA